MTHIEARDPGSATATKHKSWRDVLPIHSAAEAFPRQSHDELIALGNDLSLDNALEAAHLGTDWRDLRILIQSVIADLGGQP